MRAAHETLSLPFHTCTGAAVRRPTSISGLRRPHILVSSPQLALCQCWEKRNPPPLSLVHLLMWKIKHFHFTFSAGYRRVAATAERGNLRPEGGQMVYIPVSSFSHICSHVCAWNKRQLLCTLMERPPVVCFSFSRNFQIFEDTKNVLLNL